MLLEKKLSKSCVINLAFKIGRKGSHVRLSKMTQRGKVGTVVPMHKELKIGTLRGILKLASVDIDEFSKYL